MKEMVYGPEPKREVLHCGKYRDHKFCILSLGWHPTAYVECKLPDCDSYEDERLDGVSVHGGFTYLDTANWPTDDPDTKYLGWDYAHWGDYCGYYEKLHVKLFSKRWTVAEILEEIRSVIDQLMPLEADEIIGGDTNA